MLDLVKTIKELENIDLSNIRQLIEMSQMLKAAEAAIAPQTETQPKIGQNIPEIQPSMQQQPQMIGQ